MKFIIITSILLIAFSLFAREGEEQFFCKIGRECLIDLRQNLPVNHRDFPRITQMMLEMNQLTHRDRQQVIDQQQEYLNLAEQCYDLRDNLRCNLPVDLVNRLASEADFRRGINPGEGYNQIEKFDWSDRSKEVYRSWIKSALCRSSLTADDFQNFQGFVFFSGSCFSAWELRRWYQKLGTKMMDIFRGRSRAMCHNAAYSGYNRRIFISSDFLNARIGNEAQGYQDYSVHLIEHEMAHHQHFRHPQWGERAETFLSIRYSTMIEAYQQEMEKFSNQVQAKARAMRPNDFIEWFENTETEIRTRHQIPIRYGGETQRELVISAEVRPGGIDTHAIDTPSEYFAIALELYRHDPVLAQTYYSEEEITWLQANSGQLQD